MFCLENYPSTSQIVKQFGLISQKRRSKALGQNFILDQNILKKIVGFAEELNDYIVLEIGSGPGGLTKEILLKQPKYCIAIEKDERCTEVLKNLKKVSEHNFEILNEDALKFDLDRIRERFRNNKIKIISNLPYNIGTKIYLNLLHDLRSVDSMVLMFQKEVALRITAKYDTPHYGRLSIISQYLTEAKIVMNLSPKCFVPSPKVHSSLLKITPKTNYEQSILKALFHVTNAVFQARRKTIFNGLKNIWPDEKISHVLNELHIKETNRPENLTVENFVNLARFY